MKVVVIAGEVLKQEMLSKPVDAQVELIWVEDIKSIESHRNADAFIDLEFVYTGERIRLLKELLTKPVLINSVTYTLAEAGPQFIRINAWPTFLQRNICETAVANKIQEALAQQFFDDMGWACRFVPDVKGMPSARVVAMIINEAYYTLEAGVSTKAAIDIAMKLGTNYPYGPFEWSGKIGLKNVYDLLFELSKTEARYAVSKALRLELGIV